MGAEKGIFNFPNKIALKTDSVVVKQPDSLNASGYDMVLAQAMYAIVGAVALEQGGAVANRITRERILAHIGLKPQVAGSPEQLRI